MLLSLKNWFNTEQTPEQVMLAYKAKGHQAQLTHLVNLYSDDLYHYLLSQSDHHLALDISQKSWLKVMEKKHLYEDKGSFKAWLFTLARRLLIDEFRYQNRLQELDIEKCTQKSQQHAQIQDLQKRFDMALNKLPFVQKEAFILQQEGFSLLEISEITGQKKETIKTRLRYAKQALKQDLGDTDE